MKYRVYYTKAGSTRKHYNAYEPVRRDLAQQFVEMMQKHAEPGVTWDYEPDTVPAAVMAKFGGE